MVFSSLIFLYAFLPLCLILYHLIKNLNAKNFILMMMSVFFYAAGEPKWVFLLIGSTLLDYFLGLMIAKAGAGTKAALWCAIASAIVNVGALFYFKYTNFAISNLNLIPIFNLPELKVIMPIGISFFTFQKLTYIIDAYKGTIPVQRSYIKLLLYVSLFPQLIAGPILRYSDIADQMNKRKTTLENFAYGVMRFTAGVGKKVLIANYAGAAATALLGKDLKTVSVMSVWLGIILFSFQIYFDFSGYSDMAVGLGKMFGFSYGENFRHPYISTTITEFWRRWHISLSTFFRDYVYIPLGGNRHDQIRNLIVVWFLTGLWHGASWNFILWGMYYAVILVIEKLFLLKLLNRIPKFIGWIYSMFAVVIGWTLFYFVDFVDLGRAVKSMFGLYGQPFIDATFTVPFTENLLLIIVAAAASTPIMGWLKTKFVREEELGISKAVIISVYSCIILIASTISLTGSGFNPFLYFRF